MYVWKRLYGYATPGGDPLWECPKCGYSHCYGVEVINGPYHNCPECGIDILYPWEAKMKKLKIENLEINNIEPFNNDRRSGFYISWSANIGFGEYCLYTEDKTQWYGDSECLDTNDDKSFLEMLMKEFVKNVKVKG